MTVLRPLGFMFALVASLSACSSDAEKSNLLKELVSGQGEVVPDPTFLAYEQAGAPTYLVSLEAKKQAYTIFVRQTTNAKGEETWISLDKLSLGMKNGMIIATRGMGGDQLAGDPSQTLAALKAGRSGVTERFVTLLNGESQAETLAFRCEVERQRQADVDLGPYTADTDLFYETCRNGQIRFRNLFWVERGSRNLVQSRQWISETVGTLALRAVPR
ncbi:YjbF family lipoprotein [Roseobacter sp. TSBP12]|uniref:YjbF family lipoprotein n=1 Tax=Roseobacter sp. TSBP12 TaxID=1236613 RepID=UPI00186A0599|nr:YjbF family lipoprotein [Roseobacter sp. TSBP12]